MGRLTSGPGPDMTLDDIHKLGKAIKATADDILELDKMFAKNKSSISELDSSMLKGQFHFRYSVLRRC